MKLSDRWIEEAGFEPMQHVRIEVTTKRLVITPIDEKASDHFGKDGSPLSMPRRGCVVAGFR
ncbi:hypothetical protein WK68_12975 [Burkholderia ubonensis]|uniref:SymE family type I addiction module toxin n=1 Tax=Burkholderia ubonensis TaxID=101571 RepID=UPI00075D5050|nr:SymE family type I addiction module toxin [Burkholderia ubonensis]KVU40928.1 hypothetical protein WK68_12975 [Burkholderia ubonensis]